MPTYLTCTAKSIWSKLLMSTEIQRFAVTIPAGTLKSAPAVFPLEFLDRIVDQIQVKVPPGPRGEVGFQLGSGGLQIIPQTQGQFFVTDDETLTYALEDQIDTGAWQMIAYNTGAFNHTLEVRFFLRPVTDPSASAPFAPIDPALLSG